MSVKILTSAQFYERFEACSENEGEVRMVSGLAYNTVSNPHNLVSNVGQLRQDMVICLKLHRRYKWKTLRSLSKINKIKFMNKIDQAFRNQCISQNLETDMGAGTYLEMQQECQTLELKLRNFAGCILNLEKQLEEAKKICKKKTCVIDGCPGMCAHYFDEYNPEGFEECFCCKKKQELECPICYDIKSVGEMVCGKNCSHHICWKCYGMSCQARKQIIDCPMCRANFNHIV
jgi:hypothetical protein